MKNEQVEKWRGKIIEWSGEKNNKGILGWDKNSRGEKVWGVK